MGLYSTVPWPVRRFFNRMNWWSIPDIYIVSYPKAGRTWLRSLIGKYLCDQHGFPDIDMLRTVDITKMAGLPLAAFTHDQSNLIRHINYRDLSPDKRKYRNNKVILLGRDVRDTLVSSYFQATKRVHVFTEDIAQFIRSDRYGAMKILTFYRNWYENKTVPKDFLFIRYEDMLSEPDSVLRRVLTFMGSPEINRDQLGRAIEFCSFDNLKKREESNAFQSPALVPGNPQDPESFKVRKGVSGGYHSHLADPDIQYVNELISRFGCEFTGMK